MVSSTTTLIQKKFCTSTNINKNLFQQQQQQVFHTYRQDFNRRQPVQWTLNTLNTVVQPLLHASNPTTLELGKYDNNNNNVAEYRSENLGKQIDTLINNQNDNRLQQIHVTLHQQALRVENLRQLERERIERARRNAGKYLLQWYSAVKRVILLQKAIKIWIACRPNVAHALAHAANAACRRRQRNKNHDGDDADNNIDDDDQRRSSASSENFIQRQLQLAAPTIRFSHDDSAAAAVAGGQQPKSSACNDGGRSSGTTNDSSSSSFTRFNPEYFHTAHSTHHWPYYASEAIEKLPHLRTDNDIKRIRQVLSHLDVFRRYSNQQQLNISRVVRLECYNAGRIVIRQGHRALSFYMVYAGALDVCQKVADRLAPPQQGATYRSFADGSKHKILSSLGQGANFGEIAIILDMLRGASIVARDDCILLVVTKDDLLQYNLYDRLREDYDKRAEFLRRHPLLCDWTTDRLDKICFGANTERYSFNETIINNSDTEQFLIFVVDGHCTEVVTIDITQHRLYAKLLQFRQATYDLFSRAVRLKNPQLLPHRCKKQPLPDLEDKQKLFQHRFMKRKRAELLKKFVESSTATNVVTTSSSKCRYDDADGDEKRNVCKKSAAAAIKPKVFNALKIDFSDIILPEYSRISEHQQVINSIASSRQNSTTSSLTNGSVSGIRASSGVSLRQSAAGRRRRRKSRGGVKSFSQSLHAFKPKSLLVKLRSDINITDADADNDSSSSASIRGSRRQQQQRIGVNIVTRTLKEGDIFGLYKIVGAKEPKRKLVSAGCTVIRLSVSKFESALDILTRIRAFGHLTPLPNYETLMRLFYQQESTRCHQKSLFNSYLTELNIERDAIDSNNGFVQHVDNSQRFPSAQEIYDVCRQGNEFNITSTQSVANNNADAAVAAPSAISSSRRSHFFSVASRPASAAAASASPSGVTAAPQTPAASDKNVDFAHRAVPRVHYRPAPAAAAAKSSASSSSEPAAAAAPLLNMTPATIANLHAILERVKLQIPEKRRRAVWLPFNRKREKGVRPSVAVRRPIINSQEMVDIIDRQRPSFNAATLLDNGENEQSMTTIGQVTSSAAVLAYYRTHIHNYINNDEAED